MDGNNFTVSTGIDSIDNILDVVDEHKKLVSEGKENNIDIKGVNDVNKDFKTQKLYAITNDDREMAVNLDLVPEIYRNANFDTDKIRDNLIKQRKQDHGLYTIKNFGKYEEAVYGILSAIRARQLPNKSYIIGAPNGFGKTSFVMESIITCNALGFKTAPYISLWELAQIRVDNEQRILRPFKRSVEAEIHEINPNEVENKHFKRPEIITGKYSYSEYINADILFVHFTDVISKEIESHALYQLLSIRGSKGLPTICMISTSIDPYINDKRLKELVWDEILASSERDETYDRLFHISTYKRRISGIELKGEQVDSDTGIVD